VSGVDQHRTWLPEARLDFGEQIIPDIGFIGIAPQISREGNEQCVIIDFLAPYRGEPGEWTLIVEQLVSPDLDSGAPLVLKGPWRFVIPVH
jgi:hypothetical protein